jgi:AraC-like DNA-binding protein
VVLSLDGPTVRASLDRRFDRLPPLETWCTELAADAPSVTALRSLAAWAAAEMVNPASVLRASPATAEHLERALFGLFVECLAECHPECGKRPIDLAELRVRKTEAWMQAHLGEAVGIEDLAKVAGVAPRSVQTAFRRLRGCTPLGALNRFRLESARENLLNPDATTTVAGVAADTGFSQLGRFAVRYRDRFGEKPSETLAAARRRFGLG